MLLVDLKVSLNHVENYHKSKKSTRTNNNYSTLILYPLEPIFKVLDNKIWLIDFSNQNESLSKYFRMYK